VKWLGADWEDREFFASDYFDQIYAWAEELIEEGQGLRLRLTRSRSASTAAR
jgi:glutamyl/glutaminyl-tRNA synthetase